MNFLEVIFYEKGRIISESWRNGKEDEEAVLLILYVAPGAQELAAASVNVCTFN